MTTRKPVNDASAWKPVDLEQDRSWQFSLTAEQVTELEQALDTIKERGMPLEEVTAQDFPLPSLRELHGQLG